MFPNILENLSGGLDRPQDGFSSNGPSALRASLWFLLDLSHAVLLIPANCSGCGPGYRSPLDAMKGEKLV